MSSVPDVLVKVDSVVEISFVSKLFCTVDICVVVVVEVSGNLEG